MGEQAALCLAPEADRGLDFNACSGFGLVWFLPLICHFCFRVSFEIDPPGEA
jgi:hypothetical protein